jgi:hypothetical protein
MTTCQSRYACGNAAGSQAGSSCALLGTEASCLLAYQSHLSLGVLHHLQFASWPLPSVLVLCHNVVHAAASACQIAARLIVRLARLWQGVADRLQLALQSIATEVVYDSQCNCMAEGPPLLVPSDSCSSAVRTGGPGCSSRRPQLTARPTAATQAAPHLWPS